MASSEKLRCDFAKIPVLSIYWVEILKMTAWRHAEPSSDYGCPAVVTLTPFVNRTHLTWSVTVRFDPDPRVQ